MQRRPEQISAIESHLAYWLYYVGYRLFDRLRDQTLELGVTAAESVFLRKLHEHEQGAMPSRLASRLGLTRGHISRLAMRLEIKGLVNRTKSVSDRRAKILTLTGVGRALVPMLAEVADESNAGTFGGAGDAPCATIEAVMKWIVRVNRWRFVPPGQCRVVCQHRYRYADEDEYGYEDADGDGYGLGSSGMAGFECQSDTEGEE